MDKKEFDKVWDDFRRTRRDPLKRKLAEHYWFFVRRIAVSMATRVGQHISVDELASYGVDGLYKAIDRYDPQHKTKFETYAYIRIRGAMLDGIRSEDWIPRSVRLRQSEIEKTKQEMEAICGCKVLESDVLEALGIDPNDYHKHCNRYKPAVKSSIETSACMNFDLQGGNKKDFNRYLVAKHEISPNVLLLKQEFLSKLIGKNLTLPERRIIYMYYYESKTMKEIAEIIDMSESRVSQIHHDVLERLKTRIKVNPSYFGDDLLECMCNFSEVNQLV